MFFFSFVLVFFRTLRHLSITLSKELLSKLLVCSFFYKSYKKSQKNLKNESRNFEKRNIVSAIETSIDQWMRKKKKALNKLQSLLVIGWILIDIL